MYHRSLHSALSTNNATFINNSDIFNQFHNVATLPNSILVKLYQDNVLNLTKELDID
jgi:hypothetical protein